MSRLQIDFAPPSLLRTLHNTGPLAWAVAALALAVCLTAGVVGARHLAQQRADSAQLEAARQRAKVPVVVAAAPKAVISEAQAAAVNASVLQLNLPWRALRDAIGAATPPEVAMLALEPDAKKRTMKITAEAKDSEAMIGYVEELKKQELFAGVVLTRHEINVQDPAKPIRFQIEAEWSAP